MGISASDDGDVISNKGSFDFWVLKIDKSSTIIWSKTFGGSEDDRCYSVTESKDENIIAIGSSFSKNGDITSILHGSSDVLLLEIDKSGFIAVEKTYGGTDGEYANSIIKTTDENYVFAGVSWSDDIDLESNHGSGDYWIVKINSTSLSGNIPAKTEYSIYPNPASDFTIFQSHNDTLVGTISVTDILGRHLQTVHYAPHQMVRIDVSNYSTGTYFLGIEIHHSMIVEKVILQ